MSTSKGTLLITGASGFLGFAILLGALREGYVPHVVVRNEAKRVLVQTSPALRALSNAASCKFFIVPDFTVPGSLDAAAAGCDFIIHGASPVLWAECPPEEQEARLIAPAVACTLAALTAAHASGTVKRVVCISSLGAFASPAVLGPTVPDNDVWISEQTLTPHMAPPFPDTVGAYCASKSAALRGALEWMAEKRGEARFDFVALAPTYVVGRHALARSTADLWATSNGLFLRMLAGKTAWKKGDPPEGASAVHIDDVVELHLRALDRERIRTPLEGEGAGTEVFTVAVESKWNDVTDAARKLFPDVAGTTELPCSGYIETKTQVRYSSEKVRRVFGMELRSLEDMMVSLVPQYVELLAEEKRGKDA